MINGLVRISRIHLRIEGRDFHGDVHDREEFGVLTERIDPAPGLCGKSIDQIETASGIFVCFRFAHDRFAEEIDGESDPLFPPLAQHFHDVHRISPGDELPCHAGNIPA